MPERDNSSSLFVGARSLRPPGPSYGPYRLPLLQLLALMVASIFTGACASPPPIHDVAPAQLRAEIARDVPGLSRGDVVIPHEISEATFAALHSRVDDLDDPSRGARALLKLLFDEKYLNLNYKWGETRNAEETIDLGGGNCLSLAAVLVGTARRYSGAARYIEIQDQPERRDEGDLQIWSSHIAVLLPSVDGTLIVDFQGSKPDKGEIRFERLSDRALVAHYYNDSGYDLIRVARTESRQPPWQEAGRLFKLATRIDPHLARAWNNLGVARARLGDLSGAEAAYRRALGTRSRYLEKATSDNLASLEFRRLGSEESSDGIR